MKDEDADKNFEVRFTSGNDQRPVVWITPEGGNVRCRSKRKVQWTNATGHTLRLRFSEWLADDDLGASSVWPFSENWPGRVVTIVDGDKWSGTLAGTGQNIIKYSVDVLGVDGTEIAKLDPIIIVER